MAATSFKYTGRTEAFAIQKRYRKAQKVMTL